jgi:hypothetical protein
MLTNADFWTCRSLVLFRLWGVCLIVEEVQTFCERRIEDLVVSVSFRQSVSLLMCTVIAAR